MSSRKINRNVNSLLIPLPVDFEVSSLTRFKSFLDAQSELVKLKISCTVKQLRAQVLDAESRIELNVRFLEMWRFRIQFNFEHRKNAQNQ